MPQPRLHWSAYLWPGLPQVWLRGSWVGLTLAVGFTAIANVLLAATLVWDEWLPARGRWIALAGLGVIWVVAWIDGRAEWRRLLAQWTEDEAGTADMRDPRSDQLFRQAQTAYLVGDWVSAEKTLLELLRQDARDAESRLLLATLWRHEGRIEAASSELDRLECLETAAPWAFEIAAERERIAAASVKTEQIETSVQSGSTAFGGAKLEMTDFEIHSKSVPSGTPIAATNRRMAA